MDYFSLFSMPRSFDVDTTTLERTYFDLQRQYHPDKFATGSPQEKQAAMQMSTQVNDAYHTLKSPLLRANYLLTLHGAAEAKPDAETLMESMEMQEALAEGEDVSAQAQAAERECMQQLRDAFAADDFSVAAQGALRLSYVTKLLENIRQKQFKISSPCKGEDKGGGQISRKNGPPSQPSPLQGEGV